MEKLEQIREIVAKRAPGETFQSVSEMSDQHVVELFNDLVADKSYWFCTDCGQFHSREQLHCNLPCIREDIEKDVTEEEYEKVYSDFDPASYKDDDDHLQNPHTRLNNWLREAEHVYQLKYHRKTFDIHNGPKSPQREHEMTVEEHEVWVSEIRAFMQDRAYRHKAWKRNYLADRVRVIRPNGNLEKRIRVKTLRNGDNIKYVDVEYYVRA